MSQRASHHMSHHISQQISQQEWVRPVNREWYVTKEGNLQVEREVEFDVDAWCTLGAALAAAVAAGILKVYRQQGQQSSGEGPPCTAKA